MKEEEIIDKVGTIKNYIEEMYEGGVIKAQLYNDLYEKINSISIPKCKS